MSDIIQKYFKDVGKHKLLTKAEEVSLAKRIEAGDQHARDVMVQSNLRLAISIAKKYHKSGCDMEDLIQESNIGLMKAIDKFDWRKGYKFSTYACWWIRQAVTRHISMHKSTVRVPSHAISISKNIQKMIEEYEEEFGTEPTIDEICESLGVSEKMARASLDSLKLRYLVSLDRPVGKDGDSNRTLADIIPDNDAFSVEEKLDNEVFKDAIICAFKTLTKREEQVIRLRFGIVDYLDDPEIHDVEV